MRDDYPKPRCLLFYGGTRRYDVDGIAVLPLAYALPRLPELLGADARDLAPTERSPPKNPPIASATILGRAARPRR